MHVYIYDSFLNQKKYERTLATIETRITDLGINGKIVRLDIMKNIHDTVENEMKRGAKVIIAVGNNHTVAQIINAMIDLSLAKPDSQAVPLGIIPMGEADNEIAASLGIHGEIEACEILLARRIEKIDLGRANDFYFINKASISNRGTTIQIDEKYSMEISEEGVVNIVNLNASKSDLPAGAANNPVDGLLELSINTYGSKKFLKIKTPELINQSFLTLDHFKIYNSISSLLLDGTFNLKCPAEISAVKGALNIIVGKEREF